MDTIEKISEEKLVEKSVGGVPEKTPKLKLPEKRVIAAVVAVLAVFLLAGGGYLFASKTAFGKKLFGITTISPADAKTKAESFVRDGLGVPASIDVSLADPTLEGGLYKIVVTIQKKDYPMYLSLDGTKFFPQAIDDAAIAKAKEAAVAAAPKDVPKTAKPDVKLFVMSYCPYGTQIEKGILPVLATLGNKINFNLEFVSYSMHNNKATGDRKELDENLRQYCIRTLEPTKLTTYLGCFLKKGQGTEAACLKTAGVDVAKNTACMKQADTQFDVTKDFADESTYQGSFPPFNADKADNDTYGVQGSPTLVINGVTTDSQRDPASLLKTICAAFETAPAECQKALATVAPAAGFGEGSATAGSASSGTACGN
ncbi:MAG: hypothetical protein WCJ25_00245 [Candidatus Moraniibacteriota bacterium]